MMMTTMWFNHLLVNLLNINYSMYVNLQVHESGQALF